MKIPETFKKAFFFHFEWLALATGLILMAMLDPLQETASLCPIDRLGFPFCPGEGLGRSIAHLFRGELTASFQSHPAGVVAVFIIAGRIASIIQRNYKINHKHQNK